MYLSYLTSLYNKKSQNKWNNKCILNYIWSVPLFLCICWKMFAVSGCWSPCASLSTTAGLWSWSQTVPVANVSLEKLFSLVGWQMCCLDEWDGVFPAWGCNMLWERWNNPDSLVGWWRSSSFWSHCCLPRFENPQAFMGRNAHNLHRRKCSSLLSAVIMPAESRVNSSGSRSLKNPALATINPYQVNSEICPS